MSFAVYLFKKIRVYRVDGEQIWIGSRYAVEQKYIILSLTN